MPWFEIAEPDSVADAVALLDPADPTVRPIAGGTALLLQLKSREVVPSRLVSLHRLGDELGRIEATADGLAIGAMVTHTALERSPLVDDVAPFVARLFQIIANIRVRNRATIGGNLVHADPHMDLPALLVALEAKVEITSATGTRSVEITELATGAFTTVLARDELLTGVFVPCQPERAGYAKCTALSAGHDWPGVGVAAAFDLPGGTIADARVAIGGAPARPQRFAAVEAILNGERPSETLWHAAAEQAAADVVPITDIRGSAPFKRELVRAYTARALRTAFAADRAAVTL